MSEIQHLQAHIEVLEERLARLAAAFRLLIADLDTPVAREIQEALADDFDTR